MEYISQIQIISEPSSQKPFIVVYKPAALPSAPLNAQDENNALFQAIKLYPQIIHVKGRKEIEYGLLHRIDTPTSGLILIATTQEFYDYMQVQQKNGKFIKFYKAICNNVPENYKKIPGFPVIEKNITDYLKEKNFSIVSFFRYYGEKNKEVRPVLKNSGKAALNKVGKMVEYTTEVSICNIKGKRIDVICKIRKGFKHQVRNHLAWIGLPIEGDELYNSTYNEGEKKAVNLRFTAFKIQFEYPEGDLNSYEITPTST